MAILCIRGEWNQSGQNTTDAGQGRRWTPSADLIQSHGGDLGEQEY